jgi:site-specific DNA-methyltransferase (adenine-specific)
MENKWILGDSFKILPTMEDKSVDMILTDPPYDLKQEQKEFLHQQFLRISKGWVIVFSPPENQWILPANQYLFWIKPISTKNTSKSYSRFVEMIYVYGSGYWNNERHWSQYTNVFTDLVDDAQFHAFRKPPSLVIRLILNHSKKDDLILDPFCGSGVVGDVCEACKRSSICIDTNEY